MWFVVKTISGEEKTTKKELLKKVPIVSNVYLPIQITHQSVNGKRVERKIPLISGFLFVELRIFLNPGKESPTPEDFRQRIWNQLKKNVTHRGYFFYKDDGCEEPKFIGKARMLSDNPDSTCPDDFIWKSYIRDADMNPFIRYNGDPDIVTEDVRIVGVSFDKLARLNDVVRVVSGPMAGATGVVVSKKQRAKGKYFKDRHLEVRLGNGMCVSYPNIRKFDMVIVREAKEGENSRDSRLWHETDHFIGILQRKDHVDDAPKELRQLLSWIHYRQKESLKDVIDKIKETIDTEDDRTRLFSLVNAIPFNTGSAKDIIDKYVSEDSIIRPFLTPAEGEENFVEIQELQHETFRELIIPINLKDCFLSIFNETGTIIDNEDLKDCDYQYNAHVAIVDSGESKLAAVSWGGFYDAYEALSSEGKSMFKKDLKQKGYKQTFALFSTGTQKDDKEGLLHVSFQDTGGIKGFSTEVKSDEIDTAKKLVRAVAPSAVEFWQKERLRNWRKLVQRFVLIHHDDNIIIR